MVSLLSGFSRIVAGFEAHLLWSVLISFNFLSFCGIKVLLLLLRLKLCLCGFTRIDEPKSMGIRVRLFRGAPLGSVLGVRWGTQATWGRMWFPLLGIRSEGNCRTQI